MVTPVNVIVLHIWGLPHHKSVDLVFWNTQATKRQHHHDSKAVLGGQFVRWPIVIMTLFLDDFDSAGTVDYGAIWIRKDVPCGGSILIFKKLLQPVDRTLDSVFHWSLLDGKALWDFTDWIVFGVANMHLNVFSPFQGSLKLILNTIIIEIGIFPTYL